MTPAKIKKQKQPSALGALPPRRRLFVLEYVKDFNATQAAIRAGYKPNNADRVSSEVLSFLEVRKAVEELTNEMIDGEKSEIRVFLLDLWRTMTIDSTASNRDRLRASEMLAKFAGMWSDSVNVQANIQVNFDRKDDGF